MTEGRKQILRFLEKNSKINLSELAILLGTDEVSLANEMGVKVCDCYKKWKKLSETEDITKLLINRINHPTPEMHELFANSLFELIFEEEIKSDAEESTMYRA